MKQSNPSRSEITRADARQFIIDNLARIDIRKVEKFSFVGLLTDDGRKS